MKEFEIIFESENIYYVNITEKLIDDYLEMINNPEVSKFISLKPRFFTFEDENNWIKQKQINNSIIFSMIEKNTNEFIGNIEILEINNNIGEIGLCIIPKKQGKHYGLESIKRFIKYCVNNLKLEEIGLSVYSHNEKAINCYKKLGFVEYKREKNIGIYIKKL